MKDNHWINGYPTPIANPMSMYPLYRAQRKSWGINAMGSVVVEVETDNGEVGVGRYAHQLLNILVQWNLLLKDISGPLNLFVTKGVLYRE